MDLATLPEWAQHALAYAAIALTATTALHGFLGAIIPRLEQLAAKTDWRGDDKAVKALVRAYDWLTSALELVRAVLPRVALGRVDHGAKLPRHRKPSGGKTAAMLALAVGASALPGGCGARQATITDTVMTEACNRAIAKCGDCYESEQCTEAQAQACVQCTYQSCEVISEQIWRLAE